MDVQEFDGTYTEYNYELLAGKIDLEKAAAADQAEIDRQKQNSGEVAENQCSLRQ